MNETERIKKDWDRLEALYFEACETIQEMRKERKAHFVDLAEKIVEIRRLKRALKRALE